MKVIVSLILLVILAWLVFGSPDNGGKTPSAESTEESLAMQENERDSEALSQALNSIQEVNESAVPDSTAAKEIEQESEVIAEAEISDKGENAVAVSVEEFAPLQGVDLDKPAAPKPQPAPSDSADIASIFEQAANASAEKQGSGDNYLSAIEDEATVTDLAIRKINRAVAKIKPKAEDSSDAYLQGLAGEADETSVQEAYVAGGTEPIEDFKANVDGAGNIYVVKDGDSLSLIAAQYYGDALMYHKIYEANKGTMRDVDFIAIGQKLVIPPAP